MFFKGTFKLVFTPDLDISKTVVVHSIFVIISVHLDQQ